MESSTPNANDSTDAAYTIVQPPSDASKAELKACLETSHEVRLREKAGRFTLSIPELGLLAHGKSLESAYAKLMQAREQRILEFASEDLLSWLPKPGASGAPAQADGSAEPRLLVRLRPFLIKAAIVSALFLWAMNTVNDSARNVGYGLEKKLDGLANMSPESIEKNRIKSAQIAEKLGPIVRELAVMFHEPAPGSTAAAMNAAKDAANATAGQAQGAAAPGK